MRHNDYYDVIQTALDGHFTSRQLSAAALISVSSTRRALRRLSAADLVVEVGRGKWVDHNRVRSVGQPAFWIQRIRYAVRNKSLPQAGWGTSGKTDDSASN